MQFTVSLLFPHAKQGIVAKTRRLEAILAKHNVDVELSAPYPNNNPAAKLFHCLELLADIAPTALSNLPTNTPVTLAQGKLLIYPEVLPYPLGYWLVLQYLYGYARCTC
jgi:hypothetical protein